MRSLKILLRKQETVHTKRKVINNENNNMIKNIAKEVYYLILSSFLYRQILIRFVNNVIDLKLECVILAFNKNNTE